MKIADLGIRWKRASGAFFSAFTADESMDFVMEFADDSVQSAYGITYTDALAAHCLTCATGGVLTANEDWSKVTAYSGRTNDPEYALALAAVCTRFAAFDTVLLHGSFVDLEGNGIVFVGPSGIGKTTQVELWHRYTGADIVNGDKVFLRCFPKGVYAYGLPWKGSSPYCLNRNAPVRGIVALRQAKENRLRRLTALECMEYFVPHIFLPQWDQNAMEQALGTLDHILNHIPVWLLECRPDEEAVMLVRDALL